MHATFLFSLSLCRYRHLCVLISKELERGLGQEVHSGTTPFNAQAVTGHVRYPLLGPSAFGRRIFSYKYASPVNCRIRQHRSSSSSTTPLLVRHYLLLSFFCQLDTIPIMFASIKLAALAALLSIALAAPVPHSGGEC